MNPPSMPTDAEVREALRRVHCNASVVTPPGRVVLNREAVLDELGVSPEESAAVDELLGGIGVDLLAVERRSSLSLSLGAEAVLKPGPPPTLVYLAPEDLTALAGRRAQGRLPFRPDGYRGYRGSVQFAVGAKGARYGWAVVIGGPLSMTAQGRRKKTGVDRASVAGYVLLRKRTLRAAHSEKGDLFGASRLSKGWLASVLGTRANMRSL